MALSTVQTASITAENTGTTALVVPNGKTYSVSLSGAFVATVFLQRSFDNGTTWFDVKSYTAPAEEVAEAADACAARLFCKTGGFTSGTAVCRLGTW